VKITKEMLKTVAKFAPDTRLTEYSNLFNDLFPKYGLTTKLRVAHFVAQVAHESGGFTAVVENLNYSAEGLTKVFSKYFPNIILANKYARQPEKIANLVYANRMGNGAEQSGDGFKYRGRGLIQLTGKNGYEQFAQYSDLSIDDAVNLCSTPRGCALSALWFWDANTLNGIADQNDILKITKRINGGTNGLDERQANYIAISKIL